jgi:hypothetical protein
MDEVIYFDESSRLAAAVRQAKERYAKLDTCGHPVLLVDRQVALDAIDAAVEAERAYWE